MGYYYTSVATTSNTKDDMQNYRPDSLIFDLDGTLWDPCKTVAEAENRAALRAKIECHSTAELVRSTCGLPEKDVWQLQFPHLNEEQIHLIRSYFPEELKECLMQNGASFYPGVLNGLKSLKQEFQLFLVSNCGAEYLECFFRWSKCQHLFEDYECFGRTGKPKSENIRAIVDRNKLQSPIYIGDTDGDQKASTAAGVVYFHMKYGFGKPEKQCMEFETFKDLVEALMIQETKETSPYRRVTVHCI